MNHEHYIPEDASEELKLLIKADDLELPMFVGQGWSYRVGSDTYGGYITKIKKVGSKTMYGLVHANTVMGPNGWTDGTEECSMPNDMTPTDWIIQSGWWKADKDGYRTPKFYFCDVNGKKFNGRKCCYGWSGAYAYRDPSW